MLRMKDNGTTIILSTHDMGSVETLCDNIALVNRAEVILAGGVKDIKAQFRTRTYDLRYVGTAMEMTIALGPFFELIESEQEDDHMVAHVRISEGKTLNDLLRQVLGTIQIISVNEVLPSMNDIFIQAVNNFNSTQA
jgi:ABC-2 type transport system ATP-binding protein